MQFVISIGSSTHKPGHEHYFQVIANPSKILPNNENPLDH